MRQAELVVIGRTDKLDEEEEQEEVKEEYQEEKK